MVDKVPYDDLDDPYWECDDTYVEVHNLLEPSDFYFFIPAPEDGPMYDPSIDIWYITIVPKRLFDKTGYWFDQHMECHLIAKKHGFPWKMGCEEETTYSLYHADKISPEDGRKELEKIGFIWNPAIYDGVNW